MIRETALWLNNVDWSDAIDDDRVHAELVHIKESVKDGSKYWVDKDFGYEDKYPDKRPENEGEKIGRKLFEIFDRMEDEALAGYENRERDYARAKTIVDNFIDELILIAEKELPNSV